MAMSDETAKIKCSSPKTSSPGTRRHPTRDIRGHLILFRCPLLERRGRTRGSVTPDFRREEARLASFFLPVPFIHRSLTELDSSDVFLGALTAIDLASFWYSIVRRTPGNGIWRFRRFRSTDLFGPCRDRPAPTHIGHHSSLGLQPNIDAFGAFTRVQSLESPLAQMRGCSSSCRVSLAINLTPLQPRRSTRVPIFLDFYWTWAAESIPPKTLLCTSRESGRDALGARCVFFGQVPL